MSPQPMRCCRCTAGPSGAGVAAHVAAIAPGLTGLDDTGRLSTEALTPEQAVALGGAHYA